MTPAVFPPGLVGKVPAQGDFVRINAGERTPLELMRWLEAAQELIRRAGSLLPSTPTCFLFSAASARHVLVGVLVPSRDQVGRAFPAAAFAPLESAPAAVSFPIIPLAFDRFFNAAGSLLASLPELTTSRIAEQLNALPLPDAAKWSVADEQRRLQLNNNASALTGQFSEQPDGDGVHYALRTFLIACTGEKNHEPTKAKVVLDCPLGHAGALPWLELAARILRWKAQPPSALWAQAPAPRLLLSLGPLPPNSLGYLARPDPSAAAFWPLKTSQRAAVAAAKQALSPEQRRALEDGGISLDALFSRLAR